jgi:murein DD-endopeptidase MepM/ murein hydrolase activator NlpD
MTLSLFLIIFKGSASEGQRNIFSNILTSYIDETAASVITTVPSQSQLSEINTLVADSNNKPKPTVLTIIQDNSVVSRGTILADILDGFTDNNNQVITYTVQEGDTLSFIASDYGVSVNTVIWANADKIKSADDIKPGMDLKIPPVTGVIHKVVKGDTVASIAKKYGVDVAKIVSFNGLTEGESLQTGDELIVPDGKISSPRVVPQQTTAKQFAYLPNIIGYFIWPTINKIGYDWGRIHGRNGVDLANNCGTPIIATANGTVTVAAMTDPLGRTGKKKNGGFGNFIKLLHPNGTETLYAHLMQLFVQPGQQVNQGQEIGLMGSTGNSTGCHIHFEVHGAKNPLAKY